MHKSKKKPQAKTIIGRMELTFDGYGFVIPEKVGDPDLFVPAHAIGNVLHKDVVEATPIQGRQGKMEGRIQKVLSHGLTQVVGRYEMIGKSGQVVTDEFRVHRKILVAKGAEKGALHGEMVVVKITRFPSDKEQMEGTVIERLGNRGHDETELKILIARHNLPREFPKDVVAEAKSVSQQFYESIDKKREDLTRLPFITIDGEDAKDFDDAICAERLNGGVVRVWVSIADVSHFVKEGTPLDVEASTRATSVYLPGRCIPMLPVELSNHICSLMPDEDRYCMTAEFVVQPDGRTTKRRFYKSIIKSKYRMTYTQANDHISHGNDIGVDKEILRSLDNLMIASGSIRKRRRHNGSIDFDLPEPSIELDLTGKPEDIVKSERNAAHMLVEDLMIAANESVAEFLTEKNYPCVFRVHDLPNSQKLFELNMLMKHLGYNVKIDEKVTSPKRLAEIVKLVEGKPEERLINTMLLRSMSQAIYSVKNLGHFGLASRCYCHFTSPIRRYPDLLVHRLLGDCVGHTRSKLAKSVKYLQDEAMNSSKMERRSMEAERESISLYCAMFMRDKIGNEYDGFVSHAAKKGIFVQLVEFFVEGMILPEDLEGDKFVFDQKNFSYVGKKTAESIEIGDKVHVRVKDVNVEERRIYFEPV